MKCISTIILLLFSLTVAGQKLKVIKPQLGNLVDKSPEKALSYLAAEENCGAIWEKLDSGLDTASLTKEEKVIYRLCAESETKDSYWDILGMECSWYCGGGEHKGTTSSELKSLNGNNYAVRNSMDLSYQTAWVEGVPGYGIGEYLLYRFPPQNPRITKIIVVNGYVKSEKLWKQNSRVKKLKMYLNNKPYAILQLADSRKEQTFTFSPIGNAQREDLEKLMAQPWWTLKFEIMEVYQGDKYDDTAITEIYYDGIDVH